MRCSTKERRTSGLLYSTELCAWKAPPVHCMPVWRLFVATQQQLLPLCTPKKGTSSEDPLPTVRAHPKPPEASKTLQANACQLTIFFSFGGMSIGRPRGEVSEPPSGEPPSILDLSPEAPRYVTTVRMPSSAAMSRGEEP
eukprot:5044341-Amphidinium_carterae.1